MAEHKREETFNLGEITKGGRKTALDDGMPLGQLCCYYVGRGRLSCGVGQLETRGWSGGRVREQEPAEERRIEPSGSDSSMRGRGGGDL